MQIFLRIGGIDMTKAIYLDGAVRCEKCDTEIWEGVDCNCGSDGADHEGLYEAYIQKTKASKEGEI